MTALLDAILARVTAILGLLGTILGIAISIKQGTEKAAQENVPFHIEGQVDLMEGQLSNPTYGLAQIQADIATLTALLATDVTAILTAVGAPQQAGVPVTIDPGYAGTVSSTVWGQQMETSAGTVLHGLSRTWFLLTEVDSEGGTYNGYSPWLKASGLQAQYPFHLFNTDTPQPSVANILPTDTLMTWLTRELPAWTVTAGSEGPDNVEITQGGFPTSYEWQGGVALFNILKAAVNPAAMVAAAPVWPGLSGVTLGTAVALSDGLVVAGPMQGVIVTITSVSSPISYYPFGTIKSYVRAGALVFTNDDGDSEFPQPFGPDDELILPKSMSEAASATVRLPSGVVGTIQPFTIP